MLNTYVSGRLVRWAEWSARREDSGLGYPKQCCYTNLMPRTGVSNTTPEFVAECFETEQCVLALRASDVQMYEVIDLAYRKLNMTIEQKVNRLSCCVQTYYNRLDMAHRCLLGFMNDAAAGIVLPAYAINLNKLKELA